jgi:TonB family protein
MVRQGKRLILAMLGASAAWSVPAHAQATADGAAAEDDASSKPTPVGNPGQWFGPDSYPPEALRNREEGTVGVSIAVDANGVPTGCSVTKTSGYAALDQGTCSIFLAHVRYRPGTDSKGRAIPSTWTGSVAWRLADTDERPTYDFSAGPITRGSTVQVTLDEQGRVLDCTTVSTHGEVGDACGHTVRGIPMAPALRLNGKPVRGRLTVTMSGKIEPLPPEQ